MTKQLVAGGGVSMVQDLLKWPMLLQMTLFVLITYLLASFHFWAVVTIPVMIAAIWLVSLQTMLEADTCTAALVSLPSEGGLCGSKNRNLRPLGQEACALTKARLLCTRGSWKNESWALPC